MRERGGGGDKAIALKLCHNVTLRDFSILMGGHFGILTTGVDNLTIDNVMIDTNRDGMDIDSCSNVHISNTSVNSPNDDAIVFKGTHALGYARVSENVTITNSLVSGYDVGSLLDATYKRTVEHSPDRDGPTGRIKIGTESEGDFRNFTISNVTFDRSRGLALESVDGSHIEDIAVSNITMRDVSNAPFFLRIGSRMRAPEGVAIGTIKRVNITNVVVYGADPRFASMIVGLPGHEVEDVKLSNIRILAKGGLSLDEAAKQPPAWSILSSSGPAAACLLAKLWMFPSAKRNTRSRRCSASFPRGDSLFVTPRESNSMEWISALCSRISGPRSFSSIRRTSQSVTAGPRPTRIWIQ